MNKIIGKIILTICAGAVIFYGVNIYNYYDEMHTAKSSFSQLVTTVQASETVSPVSYTELSAKNSDYRGWIWFDSNLVSLPIVQSEENDFYLKNNLDKEYSLGGTPFIDAANSMTDQNLTIYGHTIFMDDSDLIFTPLRKLLDQNTYDQNKRFHIDWKDGIKTYQIFAVCSIDQADDSWNYTQNIFQTDEAFYDFVHQAYNRSSIHSDIDVAATDQLVTLQTCAELHTHARIVVFAKELSK